MFRKSVNHPVIVTFLISFMSLPVFNYSLSRELPKKLSVCGDSAEWPPYIYFKRDSNNKKTEEITGYSLDVISAILKKHQIKFNVKLLPWRRCLSEVRKGKNSQLALDSSYSPERARDFLITDGFYLVSPKLLYHEKTFPNGLPPINKPEDLFKIGNVCGVHGYSYAKFMEGLPIEKIDRGTKDYRTAILKTLKGRCAILLARQEVINGFSKLNDNLLENIPIRYSNHPKIEKEAFYALVSRNIFYGQELKLLINSELKIMRKSGELDRILQKYREAMGTPPFDY